MIATGIRDYISSILGSYNPVIIDGIPVYGLSGIDWEYVITGCIVVITVYSVFKIIGGMICKIF